jgi:hypothetical protein
MVNVDLYTEIVQYLYKKYGFTELDHGTDFFVYICLRFNLYAVERDANGNLIGYIGWLEVDEEDIPALVDWKFPGKAIGGSMIWIQDACCEDGVLGKLIRHIKTRYNKTTQKKGVAFIHRSRVLKHYPKKEGY